MKKIDIIIPTKDHPNDLFDCLSSINEAIDSKNYKVEIVLIDDHSTKKNRELMYDKFIKYNIYKNIIIYPMLLGKTYGFSKAVNLGLNYSLNKKYHSDYIAILHDDTQIFKNWVEDLEYILESNIKYGVVGSININGLESQSIQNIKEFNVDESLVNSDMSGEEVSIAIRNNYSYEDIIEEKVGLFGALFKFNDIKKIKKLDENLITSINIEQYVYDEMKKHDRVSILAAKSYAKHICRIRQESEVTEKEYKTLLNTTNLNVEIKNSLDNIKNNVVYTFVNENGSIPKIEHFDKDYDYICFTTNEKLYGYRERIPIWKIFLVNDFIRVLKIHPKSIKLKLFFKLHPHFFFTYKRLSIWIDSDMIDDFKTNKYLDITSLIKGENFLLCPGSSKYDCSYTMMIDMYRNNELSKNEYDSILQAYYWFHFPQGSGMVDSNVLIRKHNDSRCILVMEKVWNYVNKYYPNDRLFINFMMWVHKYDYSYIPNKLFYEYFFKLKETN